MKWLNERQSYKGKFVRISDTNGLRKITPNVLTHLIGHILVPVCRGKYVSWLLRQLGSPVIGKDVKWEKDLFSK